MRKVVDRRGGEEFVVLEPHDLDLFLGRAATKFGIWIAGTGLVMSFALGAYLTTLRRDITDTQAAVADIVQHGTRPGKQLSEDVDSLRRAVQDLPGRISDEMKKRRGLP